MLVQSNEVRITTPAGMVFLYLGNNEELDGENTVMGGYSFPLTNATVTIDGVIVVKDGMLLEPE